MKKTKKNIIIFIGIFILACIMFFNWIIMHYASDTYNIMNVGYKKYATNWSLKDGRLFMYIITMMFAKFNLPINIFVIGTLIGAIIISCICVIKIKKIFFLKEESIKNEIIITVIAFFTIFNFMYIENMYFVESFVMAISLLFFTYSAEIIVYRKKKILSLLLSLLGVLAYQGTVGYLIILTFVFSLAKYNINMENKENIKFQIKKILKYTALAIIFAVIAIFTNMILVNIVGKLTNQEQNRISGFNAIFTNIMYILKNFGIILKENIGLFPSELLYCFMGLILIIAIIYDKNTKGQNLITLKIGLIYLISIISGFVVSVGTLSSFYTGRLHFCIGSMLGFALICLVRENRVELFEKIVNIIIIIYGIINVYNCIIVTYEHKLVNKYEQQQANQINEYITNYEKENNAKIKKIAIYTVKGKNDETYINEISRKSVVTYNALRCDWAADGAINFYTGRKLEKTKLNTDILRKYLEEKTSTGYAIIDNTLIIECYMY